MAASPVVPGETPQAGAERLLSEGARGIPQPPPPDLGIGGKLEAPPDTVSLETLHQQGRAHVLR